jgi:hypothetical protein
MPFPMFFINAASYKGNHSRLFSIYQDLAFILPSEFRKAATEKLFCHSVIPLMEGRILAVFSPIHTIYHIQTHTIE